MRVWTWNGLIGTTGNTSICRKVKTLGDSDSEDDAQAWVEKSRRRQLEKEQAEKTVSTP